MNYFISVFSMHVTSISCRLIQVNTCDQNSTEPISQNIFKWLHFPKVIKNYPEVLKSIAKSEFS